MNNKSTFRPLSLALAALIGSAFTTAALAVDNPLNSIASGVANWATQSTQQYVQDKVQEGVTQTVQSVVPGSQEPAAPPAGPTVTPSTPATPIPPPPEPISYVPPPAEPIAMPAPVQKAPPVPAPASESLAALMQQVAGQSTPLPIRANKMGFHEGEPLTLTVSVPQPGYLNVISVDPDGKATVLFPNKYETDNHVVAGELTIPTAKMVGKFKATKPYGAKTVAAFLTTSQVDLYQTWSKGGDEALRPVFAELVPSTKSADRPELAGGSLSLRVCAREETCL